ncbi:hypothetical protein [Macrococcoides caseolyticum]|uniref:hypothetical protein n=1 Tax=Macrococcoides caseolyticum TaxID=69966 RepID=UPI00105F0520|nr:hypothetical protein [Macrococcus caseolyticus]TDM16194.1 hypothetical protein ETI00_07280 [Macrococcus caseolyticus]
MEKEFVTIDDIIEMGVPYPLFSSWMTNGLITIAYQSKKERFFWKKDIENLIEKFIGKLYNQVSHLRWKIH